MMAEIMGETQNPGHITTADFCGRFADLAIERGCLFDDKDARFGSFAFEHERRRRAGKRAANDYDIVIEVHRSRNNALPASKGNYIRVGSLIYHVRRVVMVQHAP